MHRIAPLLLPCALGLAGCASNAQNVPVGDPAQAVHEPVQAPRMLDHRWSALWERSVGFYATPPLVRDDGAVLASGELFDAGGRYLGPTPAYVGGGRALTTELAFAGGAVLSAVTFHEDGDQVVLVPLDQPPEKSRGGLVGRAYGAHVALDGRRAVVQTASEVVEVSLPDFAVLSRRDSHSYDESPVAALPGGGVAYVRLSSPCDTAPCPPDSLMVEADGQRRELYQHEVTTVAFSPSGDAAAVVLSSRETAVISLPEGRELGRVPSAPEAVAVTNGGRTVALFECDALRWADPTDPTPIVHEIARYDAKGCERFPSALRFSADGQRLVLASGTLTVFGLEPAPAVAAAVEYRPEVPDGFAEVAEPQGFAGIEPLGSGVAGTPRLVAAFRTDGQHYAEARVIARDARQLPATVDVQAWADAVLIRFERGLRSQDDPRQLGALDPEYMPYRRAFVDDRGRFHLDYAIFLRDGCEPHDRFVRYVRDGDVLFEITLETVDGEDRDVVAAWRKAFMQDVLGDDHAPPMAFRPGRMGGC